jgi:hypothetical protein
MLGWNYATYTNNRSTFFLHGYRIKKDQITVVGDGGKGAALLLLMLMQIARRSER